MSRNVDSVVVPLLGVMEKRNNLGSELHVAYQVEDGYFLIK
jgi:hypothetical protein